MNIAIPTILSTKKIVGVAEYLRNLVSNLQKIDTQNEYYIITFPQNRYLFNIIKENFHEIVIPVRDDSRALLRLNYYFWQSLNFKKILNKYKIDIVHFPCPWFIPQNVTSIVTVHDLVETKYNKYGFFNNYFKNKIIENTIRNSDAIISVSKNTKMDIKSTYHKDSQLVLNGPPTKYQTDENIENNILVNYGIKKNRYFIFIGTLLRHKNIINQISAFKLFYEKNKNMKFLIVGKRDNAYSAIQKAIKKSNLENYVILAGYVDDLIKNTLLLNSNCLMYVSHYEGFGFPILDAQHLSIPVITSETSSMPEIAGKGALFVNPNNINQISNAMEQVVNNDNLRSSLIHNGIENINRFSWKRCAEETIRVYNKLFDKS
ncbi:MAG TPA: glycosyltransferase family 1 protein [Ignavibacteriaceae bacterium]|nr:glycosyltransferase family 1 protein [Ignavibacteriaceae bacterium]